jgi:hypothetical protein
MPAASHPEISTFARSRVVLFTFVVAFVAPRYWRDAGRSMVLVNTLPALQGWRGLTGSSDPTASGG